MQQLSASRIQWSGMSDIPTLLAYPKILHLNEVPEIKERLVYIIESYEMNGVTVLLFFRDNKLGLKIGDWDGNEFEHTNIWDATMNRMCGLQESHISNLCHLMDTARINQAQFYFSKTGLLVDMRTHLNKFAGPGMLRDLCGKLMPTQNIIDIQTLTDDTISKIDREVILKHSSFKVIVRGDEMIPLYAVAGAKHE